MTRKCRSGHIMAKASQISVLTLAGCTHGLVQPPPACLGMQNLDYRGPLSVDGELNPRPTTQAALAASHPLYALAYRVFDSDPLGSIRRRERVDWAIPGHKYPTQRHHAVRLHVRPRIHSVCFGIQGPDYGGPSRVDDESNGRPLTQVHQRRFIDSQPAGL